MIITRRPCALLKEVNPRPALKGGCRQVHRLQELHEDRLSRPISMEESKVEIDRPSVWAAAGVHADVPPGRT